MNRISVADVQSAYEETGLLPCQCATVKTMGVNTFGCALAALYARDRNYTPSESDADLDDILGWAAHEFSEPYSGGFMRGFDDKVPLAGQSRDFREGYADGLAAALAVFGGDA